MVSFLSYSTGGFFSKYVSMLRIIHARMSALISDGASLDDIVAAQPTAEWDEVRGDPANFLNRAYASMTR